MLEDQAGVAVVEAGHQRLEGLLGRCRVQELQSGKPRPEPFILARMEGPHGQPAAAGQAYQQGRLAARAEIPCPRVEAQLGYGLGGKIGELELDDRLGAHLRRAQAEAHNGRLAQRHIHHARWAVALKQPFARLEGRSIGAHIQAGQQGPGIVRKQIVQGPLDRFAVLGFRGVECGDPAPAGGTENPEAGRWRQGPGGRQGGGQCFAEFAVGLGLEVFDRRFAQPVYLGQLPPRGRQRVLFAPLFLALGRHVTPLVVGGMAVQPQRHALQQPRQAVAAHGRKRLVHRLVHRPHVQPVDGPPLEAVGGGPVRKPLAPVLPGRGRGKGIVVVLDDKQHGHFQHRGQVQRLVKIAGAGAAVANDRQAENLFPVVPRCPGGADHRAEHLPQMADHGESPLASVAVVDVALAAPGRALGIGQILAQQLLRRGTEQQMAGQVAVQERDHVLARPQRQRHSHCRGLVADAGGHGAFDVAFLVQLQNPFLEPACQVHEQVAHPVEFLGRKLFGEAGDPQCTRPRAGRLVRDQDSRQLRRPIAAVGNPGVPFGHGGQTFRVIEKE